jgi:hypothetical protein
MFKFLLLMTLLAASFGAGYYFGQRPVGTLQHTIRDLQQSITRLSSDALNTTKNLSRDVLDTTMGIERDLHRRQGLVEAKSHLVQAKIQVLDRNFGEAAKELAQAGEALEQAGKGEKPDSATTAMHELAGRMKELRGEITRGHQIPMKKLDELQQALDRQLNK